MALCYHFAVNVRKSALFFSVSFIIFCASLAAKSASEKASPPEQTYKTRPNYYAAASNRDLDLLAQYEARGDKAAIQKMVKAKRLISLGDQEVSVVQASPLQGTVIQVRPKNTSRVYWTVKEAVHGGEKVVTVKKK